MSENQQEPAPPKVEPADPALREQTEVAIVTVCNYVARQLKAGSSQEAIRADLLKEGLPESAVNKILALVSRRPEAFLRARPRLWPRLRGLLVSLLWLIVGILALSFRARMLAGGSPIALLVIGWIAVIIGALSLAWSLLVVYVTRFSR